ncbi:DUF2911 domain-containing protein [Myxococcota bacterium]|nr:DUF2911 domain-containing protein [Myxococcota bacterium]
MRSMIRLAPAPALVAGLFLCQSTASAQGLELPQPSPKARVEQRVGLTDFAVDYSSPAAKKRKIWGDLVPYDQPWRTGANAATKLTASKDFTFAGKPVKAGSYALYTIPGKKAWTVILNTSTENWGTNGYDQAKDVLRVELLPVAVPHRERLTFIFSDTTDDGVRLDLEWEKVRLSMPITVDTKAQVTANIDKSIDEAWRPHFQAARYNLENGGDLDKALAWVTTSIGIKPTWWNNWVHAQILAKKGNVADAITAGEKAQALGKGERVYEGFFKGDIEKAVAEWKKAKK